MCGGNRNPTENNRGYPDFLIIPTFSKKANEHSAFSTKGRDNRGKQGRSICTPAKRLLGTGTGKEPPTAAFFITPNGVAARPAGRCEHTSFQPVSPVFSARKGA